MEETEARTVTRRQILGRDAGADGMASWLALGEAPAFARTRELILVSGNSLVLASDDEPRTIPNPQAASYVGMRFGFSVAVRN